MMNKAQGNPDYQLHFIEALRKAVPANLNLADEIGHVLGISPDSSYRRIRGRTEFTLNEAVALCKHFDVPLETLVAGISPEAVTFRTNKLDNDMESVAHYLQKLYSDLSWLQKYENVEMVYSAEDLPIFYSLLFPELARFKMCYWTKSILNVPEMQRLKVEDVELPESWQYMAARLSELLCSVKLTEIWNIDTMNSTYEQIKYCWDSGFFREKKTASAVMDEFRNMIAMVERQSVTGKKMDAKEGKFSGADYLLYTSNLRIGNNCILIKAGDKEACYVGYNSFNYMHTFNRFFSEQAEGWMHNLISKSTLVSENNRDLFFIGMISKIDALKKLLEEN